MNYRMIKTLSLIIIAIAITGCGSTSYEKQQFLLEARRELPGISGINDNIIEARRFSVDASFSSRELTYRIGQYEYETDFYNEFLISPSEMITEKVRNWLADSGLSRRVIDTGSYIEPTYVLEGNVTAFYGDYRDESSPKAVIELRIFLLDMSNRTDSAIIFGKTYNSSINVESEGTEGLIDAFNLCLVEILTDLENDLMDILP